MSTAPHIYRARCHWAGSTSRGYQHYRREHVAAADPASDSLTLSADPEFLGRPDHLNPEQLLVIAASSCQLLSFLAVAARAGVDVLAYHDTAEGVMPDDGRPVSVTRIALRPRIVVAAGPTVERIHRLVELAHRHCYIANSLRTQVDVEPKVEFAPGSGG